MKVDFKKELKELYNPSAKEFALVDVPPMQFLMVDGQGDPNTAAEYAEAVEALYGLAYTLKFMSKREMDRDYGVPPLEGLWWAADMNVFTRTIERDAWLWRMMIMTPDWITGEQFGRAVEEVKRKKVQHGDTGDTGKKGELRGTGGNSGELKKGVAGLDRVRLERFEEGLAVQILHIGPYTAEGPTIARLHGEYLPQNGLVENGEHHEIYLGDPRKSAPEKLKTILRQPVRRTTNVAENE